MKNEEIKTIALANGFTLKAIDDGGKAGLRPYVYDFARALIADQQAKMERLIKEVNRLSGLVCDQCNGHGFVGNAPDDYWNCPQCINNKEDK